MTNKELITLCLRYGAANIDHLSEFIQPNAAEDDDEPWDYEAMANKLFALAEEVNAVRVDIEVMGGVAYVANCPDWIEVEIRDYDVDDEELEEE